MQTPLQKKEVGTSPIKLGREVSLQMSPPPKSEIIPLVQGQITIKSSKRGSRPTALVTVQQIDTNASNMNIEQDEQQNQEDDDTIEYIQSVASNKNSKSATHTPASIRRVGATPVDKVSNNLTSPELSALAAQELRTDQQPTLILDPQASPETAVEAKALVDYNLADVAAQQ